MVSGKNALLAMAMLGLVIFGNSYGGYGSLYAYSYQNYYPSYYYSAPSYFNFQIGNSMPSFYSYSNYNSYYAPRMNVYTNFGGRGIYGAGRPLTFSFIDP